MNITINTHELTGVLFYMLPAIIALVRGNDDTTEIAWVNFFLGWTVIGWIICLIWAFKPDIED